MEINLVRRKNGINTAKMFRGNVGEGKLKGKKEKKTYFARTEIKLKKRRKEIICGDPLLITAISHWVDYICALHRTQGGGATQRRGRSSLQMLVTVGDAFSALQVTSLRRNFMTPLFCPLSTQSNKMMDTNSTYQLAALVNS